MRIELKCSCGASAIFEDNRCTYIKMAAKQMKKDENF